MPGATSIPVEWNFLFILCVELSGLRTNPGRRMSHGLSPTIEKFPFSLRAVESGFI